jgi:hypothetical protein
MITNCFSPVIRPAARRTWSTCCFFMKSPHLRLGQQADKWHRLAQSQGIVVAPQHRREELAVIGPRGDVPPFVIRRNPRALSTPAMKVGQDLRPYFARRELPHDGQSNRSLELIQGLMPQARARGRTQTTRCQLEPVPFTDSPGLEDRFRDNDSQRVSDASNRYLHAVVITSYNKTGNGGRVDKLQRGEIAIDSPQTSVFPARGLFVADCSYHRSDRFEPQGRLRVPFSPDRRVRRAEKASGRDAHRPTRGRSSGERGASGDRLGRQQSARESGESSQHRATPAPPRSRRG